MAGNDITVPMNRARVITSIFDANLAPLGTPEWWLAAYGLTNGTFADAETNDPDHDGHFTWQEHVADTVPTNTESVLKAWPANSPYVLWSGSAARVYTVNESTNESTNLQAEWSPVPGAENLPGTGGIMTNPVPFPPDPWHYYRIGVHPAP